MLSYRKLTFILETLLYCLKKDGNWNNEPVQLVHTLMSYVILYFSFTPFYRIVKSFRSHQWYTHKVFDQYETETVTKQTNMLPEKRILFEFWTKYLQNLWKNELSLLKTHKKDRREANLEPCFQFKAMFRTLSIYLWWNFLSKNVNEF